MKLRKDFGVSALFGVLVILGAFITIGIGLVKGQILVSDILPMLGAWVGMVLSAYFVVKGIKVGKGE